VCGTRTLYVPARWALRSCGGFANAAIAKRLFITERTLEAHHADRSKLHLEAALTHTGGCWQSWRSLGSPAWGWVASRQRRGCTARRDQRAKLCALQPLCRSRSSASQARSYAKPLLTAAMAGSRQVLASDHISDRDAASRNTQERRLISVSAGQPGYGAPRRNRTGDPILTMAKGGTTAGTLEELKSTRDRPISQAGGRMDAIPPW
jgi:hypothetical protein